MAQAFILTRTANLTCTYRQETFTAHFKNNGEAVIRTTSSPFYNKETVATDKIYHQVSGKHFNELNKQQIEAAFTQVSSGELVLILTKEPGTGAELHFVIRKKEDIKEDV